MRKLLMMLVGMGLYAQAYAFPCYFTLVKDNCWTDYNVTVDIVDTSNKKVVASLNMPKGKSWDRKEIACQPMQTFMLQAQYTPVIWQQDAGKIYYGKRYWSFPEEIKPGESAWNMVICYADHFQGLTLPPTSSGHCVCDMKGIPAIAPR